MDGALQFALVTFASVLFIVDPIAVIPTYLVITQGQSTVQRQATARRVAVTPLAMPMLAGPGAISTVMVLSSQARGTTQTIVVYLSITLTLFLSWITLHVAEKLVLRVGQTGIRVMTRIMGLLLAAIAVQFVITGITEAMAARP